jgi:hypothetical protein
MAMNWYAVPWIPQLVISESFHLLTTTRPDGTKMPEGYGMTVQARLFRFEGTSRSWHHESAICAASVRRPWSLATEDFVADVRRRGPRGCDIDRLLLLCLGSIRGCGDSRYLDVFESKRPGKDQPRRRYYLTDWGPRHASVAFRPILRAPLPA